MKWNIYVYKSCLYYHIFTPTNNIVFCTQGENGLLNNWEVGPYFMFYPVLYARQYCHGFLNRASYYIQSSSIYYFPAQDGRTVIVRVQEPPRVFIDERQQLIDRSSVDDEPESLEIHQRGDEKLVVMSEPIRAEHLCMCWGWGGGVREASTCCCHEMQHFNCFYYNHIFRPVTRRLSVIFTLYHGRCG